MSQVEAEDKQGNFKTYLWFLLLSENRGDQPIISWWVAATAHHSLRG